MTQHTTLILRRLSGGDSAAIDELIPHVYEELRLIARQHLSGEAKRDVLQTTSLVHEAYLRLIDQRDTRWQDRAHFMAIASTIMRRVLIDHFRSQQTAKRGGGHATLQFQSSLDVRGASEPVEIIAFDDVLTKLEELNPRHAKIVEMRFFAGLTVKETAEAMQLSEATVKNDWRTARAWLALELEN